MRVLRHCTDNLSIHNKLKRRWQQIRPCKLPVDLAVVELGVPDVVYSVAVELQPALAEFLACLVPVVSLLPEVLICEVPFFREEVQYLELLERAEV